MRRPRGDVRLLDVVHVLGSLWFVAAETSLQSYRPAKAGRSGELDDINMLMAGLAKTGKHVVRLTGGDSVATNYGLDCGFGVMLRPRYGLRMRLERRWI